MAMDILLLNGQAHVRRIEPGRFPLGNEALEPGGNDRLGDDRLGDDLHGVRGGAAVPPVQMPEGVHAAYAQGESEEQEQPHRFHRPRRSARHY
ncbi:hypothetical protein [Nonomuraea sp. NPDC050643]|uniref:hypothetical protein n=1 Tax=Nonomuraea sp. NPDC050643 TaxID=3155660 RepID=UPI0033C2402C